ncbi:MAG: hypothetical protein IJW51_07550 [Clostridia bacterium]|nr:hypothetical protein [Clostridia bacterium]
MNEFATYEFAVSQRKEGKWVLARILLVAFYITYVLAILFIGMKYSVIAPLLAFIPLSLWVIVFITWRYVNVDYEYSVTSGMLSFTKIYGNRQRKKIFEMSVKDAVRIAPLGEESEDARATAYTPEREFVGVSSMKAPDIYFMLFELNDSKNREKRRAIFYFEATAKMLSICRFYNPSGTVLTKTTR